MHNWGKRFLKIGTVFLVTVLLLELSYRFYILDFYYTELSALNESLPPSEKDLPNILFLGDSFTAYPESYVAKLRRDVPFNLINSAVSGTSILEATFMSNSRIGRFKPSIVVYQIYLGNDLLDITHRPTGTISVPRRLYHAVSDRFRVFKLLNYRLGQFRANIYNDLQSPQEDNTIEFSEKNYSPRQKMIFEQEPYHLENVLELKGGRERDFEVLVSRLEIIEAQLDKNCQLVVLIVPHCAQVNQTYHSRMNSIGLESDYQESGKFYSEFEQAFSHCTIVNPLATFKQMDSEEHRVYLKNDPHLSDYGQTVLAEVLKPYLKTKSSNITNQDH